MQFDKYPDEYKEYVVQKAKTKRWSFPDAVGWIFCTGFLGFCVGFFICFSHSVSVNGTFANTFGLWILYTISGLILGAILYGIARSSCSAHNRKIDSDMEQKSQEYLESYFRTAKAMSIKFESIPLISSIIAREANSISENIDNVSRDSHIKVISISYCFKIISSRQHDQFESHGFYYTFQENHLRKLKDPLEPTALAIAIASGVQKIIIAIHPKVRTS